MIVEILSGLLTGLGFGHDPRGFHNDGCFMAVFDVAAFRPLDEFKQQVTDLAGYLKASKRAAGFDEILYPGEIEHRNTQRRLQEGIFVEDATWGKLAALAEEYGVSAELGAVRDGLLRTDDGSFAAASSRGVGARLRHPDPDAACPGVCSHVRVSLWSMACARPVGGQFLVPPRPDVLQLPAGLPHLPDLPDDRPGQQERRHDKGGDADDTEGEPQTYAEHQRAARSDRRSSTGEEGQQL